MEDPFDIVAEERAAGVAPVAEANLPTQSGQFRIAVFRAGQSEITVLRSGERTGVAPLVRLHSECLTGDTLGSLRCDCGEQLEEALRQIALAPRGMLLYLRQEGRGIGLVNKIRAYALQDQGMDTIEANRALGLPVDDRDYAPAAEVLRALGATSIRLLTNNPAKQDALIRLGIEVTERVPLIIAPNSVNLGYLRAKVRGMGHIIPHVDLDGHSGSGAHAAHD
jgi:GTP cyclohydrolase II